MSFTNDLQIKSTLSTNSDELLDYLFLSLLAKYNGRTFLRNTSFTCYHGFFHPAHLPSPIALLRTALQTCWPWPLCLLLSTLFLYFLLSYIFVNLLMPLPINEHRFLSLQPLLYRNLLLHLLLFETLLESIIVLVWALHLDLTLIMHVRRRTLPWQHAK